MKMNSFYQMVYNFTQHVKCCIRTSFLQLTSYSRQLILYKLFIILLCFFELVYLIFTSTKIIESFFIKNASFINLCRFFFKIYTRRHRKLDVIKPFIILSHNLIKALLWLDLILFKSPNRKAFQIVPNILRPIKAACITIENFFFLWR